MNDTHSHSNHEPSHHSGEAGYEKQDVNVPLMLVVTAIAIVFTIATVIFMNEYFLYERETLVHEVVLAPESKVLRELRAREDSELHSYAVIDTAKAVYRIPIERAMQLEADEAFQQRSGEAGR